MPLSRFKRDFIKQMERNARGKNSGATVTCPKCGSSIPVPMSAVISGTDFSCPKCGLSITPTGDAPAAESIADMLEKGFKNSNRR